MIILYYTNQLGSGFIYLGNTFFEDIINFGVNLKERQCNVKCAKIRPDFK